MNRINDWIVVLLLTCIMLIVVLVSIDGNSIYGSMTDWIMQHTVLPDYMRTLFYHTGDITPNFALNIGAGQNIYYLSYYGLLSPIILVSYLFPFIKMIDYLMIVNFLIVIGSAFLIYKWLCHNKLESKIALVCSIIFLLINAFFHAHRHVMFINYMPFLILGLIGIDKYFQENKRFLYIISVFLMIMTSYYYSVGGLLCLFMYGIYKYIQLNNKFSFKSFIIDGLKFLIPMFTGILMSFILLIPTVFAILSSRSQVSDVITLKEILIPNFNFDSLLYSNYGMGFTAISFFALIYVILNNKGSKRFLGSSLLFLLVIPLCMYILNGFLYLRGKVFIPLSPMIILLIAFFLTDLRSKKIKGINCLITILVMILITIIFKYNNQFFYIDLFLTCMGIGFFLWRKKMIYIYVILIIVALCSNIDVNKGDNYVSKGTYKELESPKIQSLIDKINDNDQTFYRMSNILDNTSLTVNKVCNAKYYQTSLYSSTYNPNYKAFYDDVFNNSIPYRNKLITASSNNIMFQTLMGIKYVITDKNNIPIGYRLVEGNDTIGVYENDNILPLGYSTSSLMSTNDYNKLDYPYRNEALLNNIVIDKQVISVYSSMLKKITLNYDYVGNLDVKQNNQVFIIDAVKKETVNLKLREPLVNQILFIRFKLNSVPSCSTGDISIMINQVTNKLTCKQWLYFNNNYQFEYVISSPNDLNNLEVTFSKGHFEIDNIEIYSLDYSTITNSINKVDPFIVNKDKTKGNVIEGKINVTNDGYFATTIPYDKGFTIYVNGKELPYEMVNQAFLGFPITKGTYDIKITYRSPGFNIGVVGSTLGFIACLILWGMDYKKSKDKTKKDFK